jgi:hypothetical protein
MIDVSSQHEMEIIGLDYGLERFALHSQPIRFGSPIPRSASAVEK